MADQLTDTEIVAACARAASKKTVLAFGVPHVRQDSWYDRDTSDEKGALKAWNPLTDRAQAMELVEKLEMHIACTNTRCWETYALGSGGKTFSEDLLRAICLCAARVQIEKEKNA